MTLTLKIQHLGAPGYAASIRRQDTEILRLEPGAEGEASLWSDAPLSIVEVEPAPQAVAPVPAEDVAKSA